MKEYINIAYSSKGLWKDILLSPTYLWVYGEVYEYYLPLQWFMEGFIIVTFSFLDLWKGTSDI